MSLFSASSAAPAMDAFDPSKDSGVQGEEAGAPRASHRVGVVLALLALPAAWIWLWLFVATR